MRLKKKVSVRLEAAGKHVPASVSSYTLSFCLQLMEDNVSVYHVRIAWLVSRRTMPMYCLWSVNWKVLEAIFVFRLKNERVCMSFLNHTPLKLNANYSVIHYLHQYIFCFDSLQMNKQGYPVLKKKLGIRLKSFREMLTEVQRRAASLKLSSQWYNIGQCV